LIDAARENWKSCEISDLEFKVGGAIVGDDNFNSLISDGCDVKVDTLAVGFASLADDDSAVMTYAEIDLLTELKPGRFGDFEDFEITSELVAQSIESEVEHVFDELQRRFLTFKLSLASEYTMREFITPLLVSAALVVGNIQLFCERQIKGSRANGPIDYVALYRAYIVCVTEAKKTDLIKGVRQNVAEIKACREAFRQHQASIQFKNKKRFREVDESAYRNELSSTGIVTTGQKTALIIV